MKISKAHKKAAKPRDLTAKQQAFVTEYLRNGRNAGAAYRSAYGSKASPKSSSEEGQRLLKHPVISRQVVEVAEKVTEAQGLTREGLVANVAKLANYDLRGAFEWDKDGKITLKASDQIPDDLAFAITSVEKRADGTIKLGFADKRAAAVDLAKLRGWLVERREVRKIKSFDDLSDEELNALANTRQGDR
jgi:predicted nucleic acid-binding OB-fold protein